MTYSRKEPPPATPDTIDRGLPPILALGVILGTLVVVALIWLVVVA